jgi:hypothetical protein
MLEDLVPPDNGRGCRVKAVLASLEPNDRQVLEDALADTGRWSSHGLMVALKQRGVQLSVHPIINHRKGICKCSKT